MKKIAIVGRVTFPHECPRSNRIKNLAIEFVNQGYDVTIYCLLGNYDYTEFIEKHGVKFENLGRSYLGNGNSDTGKQSNNIIFKLFKRIFGKIIMFPEVELIYLIYKKRKSILRNNAIISIAAPFAIHFGVNHINTKNKVWISDCGDPFMGNPHYNYPFYFKYLEKKWAKSTSFITVPTIKAIPAYPQEFRNKIKVIPQGFPLVKDLNVNYQKNKIVTFCYSGAVYPGMRDPSAFLDYILQIDKDFRFVVYTRPNSIFHQYMNKLGDKLIIRDYIPRDKLLIELSKMDFLLNIRNVSEVQVPSKLIDYYMTERPVLEISSDFKDEEIKEFHRFLSFQFPEEKDDVNQYDIRFVTKKFINLIKNNCYD